MYWKQASPCILQHSPAPCNAVNSNINIPTCDNTCVQVDGVLDSSILNLILTPHGTLNSYEWMFTLLETLLPLLEILFTLLEILFTLHSLY